MPEERWIIQRRQGVYPIIAGVVDMLRIGGRHASDSVVGMLRIMQNAFHESASSGLCKVLATSWPSQQITPTRGPSSLVEGPGGLNPSGSAHILPRATS